MRVLRSALIILMSTLAAVGQQAEGSVLDIKAGPVTSITKAQFDTMILNMKHPPSEWKGKGRRVTVRYKDDRAISPDQGQANDNKEVFEYDAKGSVRRYWELGPWAKPAKAETLVIGTDFYRRVEGEKWTRLSSPPQMNSSWAPFFLAETEGYVTRFGSLSEAGSVISYGVASVVHKGNAHDIFSRTLRSKSTNPQTGVEIDTEKTYRYWLSDTMRIVRFEQLYIVRTKASVIRQNMVSEFEFDPLIVINTPVL